MDRLIESYSLNCRGRLVSLQKPLVMGILNLTPDSFSDGGKFRGMDQALDQTERMLTEGASIIDIGGYSSRPGAEHISVEEELSRISGITERIMSVFPEALISIDTFRPKVARDMLDVGVHIINDISAGANIKPTGEGPGMMEVIAGYRDVPYIMMHMQGRPQNMQANPRYKDVVDEIWKFFVGKISKAREAGIGDLIIDPGFGFGKQLVHNYQLLGRLEEFQALNLPMMVGISRKSMLYKLIGTHANDVISLSSALHLKALEKGAHLLRVHDVKEAVRIVELFEYMRAHGTI